MTDLDATGRRDEADHRSTHLAESVAEPRVLESETEADRLPGRGRRVVGDLDLVENGFRAGGAVVHDLTGAPHLAGPDHVAFAHLPARDPDLLGQAVDHALHRELGLVRTETAERTADEIVGTHGDRLHVDRIPTVRPTGVAGGTFEHLHADAGVGARVPIRARAAP